MARMIRSLYRFVNSYKVVVSARSPLKRRRYFSFGDQFIGRSCGALPTDVPKGHCAVYVGSERSRFIIPTDYLNHNAFPAFPENAEEEYGFDHHMGLIIPCEEACFRYLTSILQKKDLISSELDELTDFLSSTFCYCSVIPMLS